MLQNTLRRIWRHPLLPPSLGVFYLLMRAWHPMPPLIALLGLMVFRGARIHGMVGGAWYGVSAGPLVALYLHDSTGSWYPPALGEGFFWAWVATIAMGISVGALTRREKALTEANRNLMLADKRLSALYRIAASVSTTLDLNQMLDMIIGHLEELFHYENCAILLKDENGSLVMTTSRGYGGETPPVVSPGSGVTGWVAEHGEPLNIPDVSQDPRYIEGLPGARSELAVPIIWDEGIVGVLNLESRRPHAYTEEDVTALRTVAEQVASAIANARLHQKTRVMAITDDSTGLYNYRHYQEQVQALIRDYQLTPGTFSLLMVDLDKFKHVNDTYGHPTGDAILRQMAEMLQRGCRGGDRVFRYGGEEFAIILPDAPKAVAMRVAERVRHQVAGHTFTTLTGRPLADLLSCSIGVANYPEDAISHVDLLIMADNALYAAKSTGRNRVVPASRSHALAGAESSVSH